MDVTNSVGTQYEAKIAETVFAKEATSILKGGADDPTSVFIAGKGGNGFGIGTMFVGILLVVAEVVIFIKSRKK